MDVPFIKKAGVGQGYSLEFRIPLMELEQAHNGLDALDINQFEKFVSRIYATCTQSYTKPDTGYPKLYWEGKLLVGMIVSTNDARVDSKIIGLERHYQFRNIEYPWQAIVALQILAEYVNCIKQKSKSTKS